MTDKSVYGGLFQDPPYISSDVDPKKTDPYVKEDCISSRYLGRGMGTKRTAPGQNADSFFSGQYLTLASADQNAEAERILNAGKKKKSRKPPPPVKPPHISDREFRYSSFPQESTGAGSFYGCFQDRPFEYMTEPWDDGKKKKKSKPKETKKDEKILPNIKTNPPKKGTYGVPGTLLDNPPYNEHWKSDMAAIDALEAKRNKNKPAPPKNLGPAFHISGVSHAYFDEQAGTGAPAVYNAYEAPPEKGKKKKKPAKVAPPPASIHEKPFKVSGEHTGEEGNLNGFPNVWVDPAALEASSKKKKNVKKEPEGPIRPKGAEGEWKPNSFEKTSIISSCLRRFY